MTKLETYLAEAKARAEAFEIYGTTDCPTCEGRVALFIKKNGCLNCRTEKPTPTGGSDIPKLLKIIELYREALTIAIGELEGYSAGRRDQSFEGWQMEWREVKIRHESDYEFYPNHVEKAFISELRATEAKAEEIVEKV